MCHKRSVKQLGRCKSCMETRCLGCGAVLTILVRTVQTIKFRKKQWEHTLYEHKTHVKTRTYDRICVNPACSQRRDPAKLGPFWIEVPAKVEPKSFDSAVEELEQELAGI